MTLNNDALYQMRKGYRCAVQIDETHETSRIIKSPQNTVSIIKQEIGILSSVLFRHVVFLYVYKYLYLNNNIYKYLSTIALHHRTLTSYHLPSHLPCYHRTCLGPYHRTRVPYHRTVPPYHGAYHRTVPPYLSYPVLSVPDLTFLFHTYLEL